jgi:hypothetical protein
MNHILLVHYWEMVANPIRAETEVERSRIGQTRSAPQRDAVFSLAERVQFRSRAG